MQKSQDGFNINIKRIKEVNFMYRTRMHLKEETPKNVVRDIKFIFTLLRMPYNVENDVYTITDINEMGTLYNLSRIIEEKGYLPFIELWEDFDSDPMEFDNEDYIYTFTDTNEKFAKIDVLKVKREINKNNI